MFEKAGKFKKEKNFPKTMFTCGMLKKVQFEVKEISLFSNGSHIQM